MRRALVAAGAGLALLGQAAAEEIVLDYEMRAMGFTVAEARVTARFDEGRYAISIFGQNAGLADLVGSLTLAALSSGAIENGAVRPSVFGTDNTYDGEARQTRVAWTDGRGVTETVLPSLDAEERSPIPDDAREGSLDPIAAMLDFALGEPSRHRCIGSVKVFDARRSYTLTLSEGAVEPVEIGDVEVSALKCRLTYQRTGGKAPDSWLSSSSDTEDAEIWFWVDGSGRALPVRIEGDAPIGSAVAELSALPARP